jgi:acetyltransferase-like isoleucine patch superfamily enzyme
MAGWNAEFLDTQEVEALCLGAVGRNVLIHRTAVLVNCAAIFLGDHIRIDPFVLISAGEQVRIGRNAHIAAYVSIVGAARIELGDFANLSMGVRLLSATDDFSGAHLMGPTIPERYKSVHSAPVAIGRHVIVGAGSVILPGCGIGEGAAVGALSLVNRPLDPWMIYAGAPVRPLRERRRDLLQLEAEYLAETTHRGALDQ